MPRVVEIEVGEGAEPSVTSHAAAERLFRKHGEWLRKRLARRFGADLADDIVQDTWARLISRGDLEELDRPKPFLVRIAANLLLDRRRRSDVRPSCVPIDGLTRTPSTADGQTQTVLLRQIINGMPEPLRAVFLLSRLEGWTYQYLERGQGKLDLEKLALFAKALDADPFAILFAAQFGSSPFAVRAAGNKAAMVLVMALEQFNEDAGDRLARIDTARLLAAMSEAFRKLLADTDDQDGPSQI